MASPSSPRSPRSIPLRAIKDADEIGEAYNASITANAFQGQDTGNSDFKPLFIIIADDTASATHHRSLTMPVHHHHPHVYYLFSDDSEKPDGDGVLTAALLDALASRSGSHGGERQAEKASQEEAIAEYDRQEQGQGQERYLIIDMAADGKSVKEVKSLSRDWQALAAEVKPAPSFDGNGNEGAGAAASMLWVEGVEVRPRSESREEEDQQKLLEEELPLERVERLRREFEKDMNVLRGWVGPSQIMPPKA